MNIMNAVKIKTEKPFGVVTASSRASKSNTCSGGVVAPRVSLSPSSPIEVIDLSLSDSDDDDGGNINANTTNTTSGGHCHAPSPTLTAVLQKSRESPQQQQQHGSYVNFGIYGERGRLRKRSAPTITQDDDIDIEGDGIDGDGDSEDAPNIFTPRTKKKKKSTPSNNTTNAKAGARRITNNVGHVGYKFQKEFVEGGNIKIFYGEVIEILDRDVPNKKGKYRRCLYNDGDTEDLSLMELRNYKACITTENNDCSSTPMVVDAPSSEAGSTNEEEDHSCDSSTGRKGSTNEDEDNSCDSSTSRKGAGDGKGGSLGLSYEPMEEECDEGETAVDKAALDEAAVDKAKNNDCDFDDVSTENEDDNDDDDNESFSIANVLDEMQVEARECKKKRQTKRRKLRKYKTTLLGASESDASASEQEEERDKDEIDENRDETMMATGEKANNVQDEDDAGAMASFRVSESDASAGKRAECDIKIDEDMDEVVAAQKETNNVQDEDDTDLVHTLSSSSGANIASGSVVQEARDEEMMMSEQPAREATDGGSYPLSGVQGERRCPSEDDYAGVVQTIPDGSDSIGSDGSQEESEKNGIEMSRLNEFAGLDMAGSSGADGHNSLISNGCQSDGNHEHNSTSAGQCDGDNSTGSSEVLSKVDSNTDEEFGFGTILPEIDLNPSVNDLREETKDDMMQLGDDRAGFARTFSEGNSGLDFPSSRLNSQGDDESGILNSTSPKENSKDEEGLQNHSLADISSGEEDLFASCDEEEDVGDGCEQHPIEHVKEPRNGDLNLSEAKIHCQNNGSTEHKDATNNMDSTNSDDDDLFCSSSDDDEDLFSSDDDNKEDEDADGDHTNERQHFLDIIHPNYNDYEDDDDDGRFSEVSADDIMEDDDNNHMAVSYSESNRQGLSFDQSAENRTSPQKKTTFVAKKWGTTLMSDFTTPIVEREVPECYYFATQWGHRMKVRERPVGKGPPPSKLKSFGIKYEILFSELKTTKGKGPAEDGSE
mmetsp:Transcript_14701/g.28075  ORF Transcript_14701/g.28075 Transcript_14701/m.28075 type:complete len:997 (+) Transcript_14701:114-3104(+)